MDDSFTCPNCFMSFGSMGLMEKHRRHFCVGADDEEEEEEEEEAEDQEAVQETLRKLERLKQLKSELLQNRAEKEKRLIRNRDESARKSSASESLWDEKSTELLNLQKGEHRKCGEKQQKQPDFSNRDSLASSMSSELAPTPTFSTPLVNSSEQIVNLMEVNSEDYNKRRSKNRQQMNELMTQKQAIENRLREFEEEKTKAIGANSMLYDELMARQEANQLSLLRLQQAANSTDPSSSNDLMQQQDFLLKQINVVRKSYLDSGGCNPEILLDIAEMEKGALELLQKHLEAEETEQKNKERYRILNEELEAFESENKRLEKELITLHESNTETMELRANHFDGNIAEELMAARRRQHAQELERIEGEIDLARQENRLNKIKRRLERLK